MIQLCCLLTFRSDAKAAITGLSSAAPVALWDKTGYAWHFAPERDLVPPMLASPSAWNSCQREGLSRLKMLLKISWTLWSWLSWSQKTQPSCCGSFTAARTSRCCSAETDTSGDFHPCSNTEGRQGLANSNKSKTYKEKCIFKWFKCKQQRIKRRNEMVKNTLRVFLQELVVLTDIGAQWVWTRNQHKTSMK